MANSNRKSAPIVTAVLLVGAIVAGATFAWLNDRQEQTNTLSYVNGGEREEGEAGPVGIQLGETRWSNEDQYQFVDYKYRDDAGNVLTGRGIPVPSDPNEFVNKELIFGSAKADKFYPGVKMDKNPQVRAIGQLTTFVGVKVSGTDDGSRNLLMKELELLYDFGWNTTASDDNSTAERWQLVHTDSATGDKYFVYKDKLFPEDAAGYNSTLKNDMTTELFSTIAVRNEDAANKDVYTKITYNDGKNGGTENKTPHTANIKVTAYSVQAENDSVENWSPLKAMTEEFGNPTSTNSKNTDWKDVFDKINTP